MWEKKVESTSRLKNLRPIVKSTVRER